MELQNKIELISFAEFSKISDSIKSDTNNYLVELDGDKILYLYDYLNTISEKLNFPLLENYKLNLDGYYDWITDLSWIEQSNIFILIYNFENFLIEQIDIKEKIVNLFKKDILKFWDTDVVNCVVGGQKRAFSVYLINKSH
ncbi:hypothetical protein FACS1894132_06050 [Clostridia bacterium]|nr:hypothetical protein FACS1894132_06050 [Clostridia bacterium]